MKVKTKSTFDNECNSVKGGESKIVLRIKCLTITLSKMQYSDYVDYVLYKAEGSFQNYVKIISSMLSVHMQR